MKENNLCAKQRAARIQWIDLARTLAILFVVLCHAAEQTWQLETKIIAPYSWNAKLMGFTLLTLGRLGVPLFLMISGYLLLDRQYDEQACRRFYKNNWLPLFVASACWFVIYNAILTLYWGKPFVLEDVVLEIFMMKGIRLSHMWYIPMIVGLYLLIPYAAAALRTLGSRMLLFPLTIYLLYTFGRDLYNGVLAAQYRPVLGGELSLGFSGGIYGIYMITGYLIKKGFLQKLKSWLLAAIAVACVAAAVACMMMLNHGYSLVYNMWYTNPFVAIGSACLFALLSRVKKAPFGRICGFTARYAFAVYLLHNVILQMIFPTVFNWSIHMMASAALLTAASLGLSLLLAWLINKIPKCGRILFLIR